MPRFAACPSRMRASGPEKSKSRPTPSWCWLPPAADAAHPAFSKMFVQTEYDAKAGVILATRRQRSPTEPEVWAAHLAIVEGETVGDTEMETDRARFLGRGREQLADIGDGRKALSAASEPSSIPYSPCAAACGSSRARQYASRSGPSSRLPAPICWVWSTNIRTPTPSNARPRWPGPRRRCSCAISMSTPKRPASFSASPAMCFTPARPCVRRPTSFAEAAAARRGCGPRAFPAIIPIVLVRIDYIEDIAIVGQLLRAHEYWRMKQLAVDLVILNERSSSYIQDLHIAIETMVRTSQSRPQAGADHARGGVFVLRADLISQETRALLPAVARVVLAARQGSLSDQLDRLRKASVAAPPPQRRSKPADARRARPDVPDLEFFNGLGGFAADGREYVTILKAGQVTPAPWINVIANRRVRLSGRGRRRRLYLVGQQPGKPTDAVVERSRDRPAGRSHLRARRGHRRIVGTDRPADPRRGRAVCRSPWPGIQPVRARRARHRARSAPICSASRSDQDFAPEDPQHFGADAAAFGHGLCRMGAWSVAQRIRTVHRDGDRSRNRRSFCPQSLEYDIRLAGGVRGPGGPADKLDRRPAGIPRPQRIARQSGRARSGTRRRFRNAWARASIRAAFFRRR